MDLYLCGSLSILEYWHNLTLFYSSSMIFWLILLF